MKRFLIIFGVLAFILLSLFSCKKDDFNKNAGHYGNTDTNTSTNTSSDTSTSTDITNTEYIVDENGIAYSLKDDNTLKVIAYTGNPGSFTIPTEYKGYTVTEIGEYAFYGYENQIGNGTVGVAIGFVTIRISETVTKIGKGAFKDCDGVKVQYNSINASLTVEEWLSNLIVEEENDGVLDTINYKIPAIGWGPYVK